MGSANDVMGMEHLLEGEWRLGATNVDTWVNGTRRDALFRFSIEQESPLVITEEQVFTSREGKEKHTSLTSKYSHGEFIAKGRKILGTMSRWTVGGASPDGSIVVIRLTHERGGQDGLLVLVRSDHVRDDVRTTIATQADEYSIGPEDFASLTWLPGV